jgi:D-hydroxyproline dehydrogenase subunit beta
MRIGIVGAGIAGLSHATLLSHAGHEVTVFERDAFATGASVRNFGMIWPVGQPSELVELAIRCRNHWEALAREAGFFFRACGSLHVAHHPLEMQVLEEFAATDSNVRLLTAAEVSELAPLVQTHGLQGGMHSASEACVDPREAVHQLARFLAAQGVAFQWQTPVASVSPYEIETAPGETHRFDHVIAGMGPALPETDPLRWRDSGMIRCRLHMMRFRPLTPSRIGIHLAFGLTLSHYANFANCPSLAFVRDHHAQWWPRQKEFGIHILISEHADGTITVGDSHEYGDTVTPYRRAEIDDAILEATNTYFRLENYALQERWEGVYPTHPTRPFYLEHAPGLTVVNLFGTGMTLSFGVAERTLEYLS